MPVTTIAANWKMNTTLDEAIRLAGAVRDGIPAGCTADVILCPPFISLQSVRSLVDGSAIRVGAQNMYCEPSGAFTGETSPPMLQGICDYVLLGHSERRQIFGETDELVNLKVKAAFAHGLNPILCVGETLEQREAGDAGAVVDKQLRMALDGIVDISGLLVAYEPVWAIGTGQAATPEIAAEIMGGALRSSLVSMYDDAAADVPLLYGGSVNGDNVAGFLAQTCIHGALVGGASLQADQFLRVVHAAHSVKA